MPFDCVAERPLDTGPVDTLDVGTKLAFVLVVELLGICGILEANSLMNSGAD